MISFTQNISGILEIALSVIGAALLVIQTLAGMDGMAQIASAAVALIAPVCGAIRAVGGGTPADTAEAVADAITETLGDQTDA